MIGSNNRMTKNLAVKLERVSKIYLVHHEKPTLTERVIKRDMTEKFRALDGIDMEIYRGEKVGIVGVNGSGKTTLLKIIIGVATPSSGKVSAWGKVVSLIDLQAGFHPDLSGYENIFLNGLIVGMRKAEIINKMDMIVRFADIGKFIDAPLYTYSWGMKLRLGFSVAVNSDPDILVLDEGTIVGDKEFQEKCGDKIDEFYRAGKTIIIVSHWLALLEKWCERIIWINGGKIVEDGGLEVVENYKSVLVKK